MAVSAIPRRRGRGVWLLALFLIAVALLWVGYWYVSNRFVSSAVQRIVASFAADGRSLSCGEGDIGGFPLSLDLDCTRAAFADSTGMTASIGGLQANAPLYWPGSVTTTLAGPLAFHAPAEDLELAAGWKTGLATIDAGLSGLNGASLTFDDFTVNRVNKTRALPFTAIAADHAEVGATPGSGRAYYLSASADGVVVSLNPQKALPEFDAEIAVTALDFGGTLGKDPKRTIAAWLSHGGKLRIDNFAVIIGDTTAKATGTLELSKDGVLSGDLLLRLSGLEGVPNIIENFRPKIRDKVEQVVVAVSALTKPAADDPEAREVPVSIKQGTIAVGFIPIATLPPLKF